MGTFDQHDFSRKDASVQVCENILIVASPHSIESLDWTADAGAFPGLVVVPCENTVRVSSESAAACSLLVLEIDPRSRPSMDRLADVKRRFPDLPVIAAIADASMTLVRTLVREGVADVMALPFQISDLLDSAVAVLSQKKRARQSTIQLAPMIAMAHSIGGCGTTSVATHLAAEIGQLCANGGSVAIVDLDLQFGSVADFMSGIGRGSITDLLSAEGRLDEDLMRSVARPVADNVAVFAAPDIILPIESIETDRLLNVLDLIRSHYTYVILDMPANWTNWALSAVSAADKVLMVVELSVASLRQAKRQLDLFSTVDIEDNRVAVVVNRVQRRLFRSINVDDVAQTLGQSVIGSVTLEEQLLGSAQDQGVLIQQIRRKSRFRADIRKIAEHLVAHLPTESSK
jgi:pilus assembly protein CpaE